MSKKTEKWIKKRHGVMQNIAKFLLYPIVKIKYGAKIEKSKDRRQKIVLSNHQTGFDQFFLAYAFKEPLYYVATEDIFSNGFISRLIKYAVNPIPIKKQTTDVRAVMNCLKVAKEGGSIGIFPEGNRTFSGTTEHISTAIVKLVKALKLPLVLFLIKGGYGVQPRWADRVRKGKIRCFVSKTVEPEEYLKMSDEELFELIKTQLFVDEREIKEEYLSKNQAEYLERAVYVCPYCKTAKFESRKNRIRCVSCQREIEYLPDKTLKGVGFDFPFASVKEWYDFQNEYMNDLDTSAYLTTPLFEDEVKLFEVELYKRKKLLKKRTGLISYGDRLVLDGKTLYFKDISSLTVLGKNKINVYHDGKAYQIKGDKRFNAVKYVNIYHRRKNVEKGEINGKFLGL